MIALAKPRIATSPVVTMLARRKFCAGMREKEIARSLGCSEELVRGMLFARVAA